MKHGEIVKILKKHDVFASFIGTIVHDYEHPGYSNQFIVRTKHPLATRYSDISVLENHHLAVAFKLIQVQETGLTIMPRPTMFTKMAIILPTGQWYAPSAVITDAWYCMVLHCIA